MPAFQAGRYPRPWQHGNLRIVITNTASPSQSSDTCSHLASVRQGLWHFSAEVAQGSILRVYFPLKMWHSSTPSSTIGEIRFQPSHIRQLKYLISELLALLSLTEDMFSCR